MESSLRGSGRGNWPRPWLAEIRYPELTRPKKNFYTEHPVVFNWTSSDVEGLRIENGIEICPEVPRQNRPLRPPAPVDDLSLAKVSDQYLQVIRELGVCSPTPIQMQVWPAAMCGYDIIGVAPTGSGKTLAYLVPLFEHCTRQPGNVRHGEPGEGPIGLVILPNPELARQAGQNR